MLCMLTMLLCVVFSCFLVGIIFGQDLGFQHHPCNTANGLGFVRGGACRLGGCLGNEYRLPGENVCNNIRIMWLRLDIFLCVDTLPCCSKGGNCRNVCQFEELSLNATTDCTKIGTSCCVPGKDKVARGRELVAQRQGACGRLRNLGTRIFGGRLAQPLEWPWMARLVVNPSNSSQGFCAGVLVDDDTVLTIARCIYGIPRENVQVVLGDFDISVAEREEELASVRSIEINPNFVFGLWGNNLAVIKLTRPVTLTPRIFPACLPDPDIPLKGDPTCFIAGWGRTESGQVSSKLRTARVNLLDVPSCNAVLNSVNGNFSSYLPSDVICAETASTNTAACLHDDGGMLVCLDTKNRYSLIGLISQFSCRGRLPIVFTRISNYTVPILARL